MSRAGINPRGYAALFRLFGIARVICKHGLSSYIAVGPLRLLKPVFWLMSLGSKGSNNDKSDGQRIREALQELGPVFVKFGQALSTRPDLLPDQIAQELALLQDDVPPFPTDEAISVVETSLDNKVSTLFKTFDEQPLASASVAQVYLATLHNDDQVVVKVLRPGIHKLIARDLELLYALAAAVHKYWEEGPRLRPLEVVSDYDNTIHNELDLRMEAANAAQMKRNLENLDIIYVPQVYWEYTREKVMVMERINGTPIREVEVLKQQGVDMRQLAHNGVTIFFTQAFRDGFFHADMHPGNIFVTPEGRYQAVDFGIMGALNETDKQYLAQNLLGFFNRDYRAVAEAHVKAEWVPAHTRVEEFEAAIRTVCEPIFAKPISEISFGRFLVQLFQTARRFEMPVQPQLVLLQKTLLNIEGLGRQLYPQLDLWETAKPFLEKWMSEQLGFGALRDKLKTEAPHWGKNLPELPNQLYGFMQDFRALRKTMESQETQITELNRLLAARERGRQRTAISTLLMAGGAGSMLALKASWLTLPASTELPVLYGATGMLLLGILGIVMKRT